jgi:hypothetical protein
MGGFRTVTRPVLRAGQSLRRITGAPPCLGRLSSRKSALDAMRLKPASRRRHRNAAAFFTVAAQAGHSHCVEIPIAPTAGRRARERAGFSSAREKLWVTGLTIGTPIIALGSFNEVGTVNPVTGVVETTLLNIDAPHGMEFLAAPEPSTWAMMLVGFAGLGFMGYARRAKGAARSRGRDALGSSVDAPGRLPSPNGEGQG